MWWKQRALLRMIWWGTLGYWAIAVWAQAVLELGWRQPPPTPFWALAGSALCLLALSDRNRLGARWLGWLGLVGVALVIWRWRAVAAVMGCAGLVVLATLRVRRDAVTLGYRWGRCGRVQLDSSDRFLHLHVLGPTGSGKSSSVLMPLIAQDLKHPRGVGVIDPKGDLAYTAYRLALAQGRTVVFVDPDREASPHYNPLSGDPAVAAEGLAWALEQIQAAGHPYYQTLSRVLLFYTVLAVKSAYRDQADVGHVLSFLRHERTQRAIVAGCPNPTVVDFFRDQWSRQTAHALEDRQGLTLRLELLWSQPAARRLLSGPGDVDFDTVLAKRQVLLATVNPGRLGRTAYALASLFWHGLAMASWRRQAGGRHPPFYLYLDEFQEYVTPDFGDFLALARGYQVGLVLAHQNLAQLSPALRASVLANARQRIVLGGLSWPDFEEFRHAAQPYPLPASSRYAAAGEAWVQLTRRGQLQPPQKVRLRYHPLQTP
jgi:hypothetical protein